MSFQISQPGTRLIYQTAKAEMQAAGLSLQRAVLTQSELRSEVVLNTTTTNYTIPILINQNPYGNTSATEKRLQLQDAFLVGSLGFFIGIRTATGDYSYPLWTYPTLEGGFFTAALRRDFYALYNGSMSLTVDQKVLITYWDMWKHFKVNQTQAQVGVTAQTVFPTDETDLSSDGFYPVEPNVVHIGSTNIQMNISLPAAIAALPTDGTIPTSTVTDVRLICLQRGVLAQNVTSITNS
jgi:hypothetical protein